MSKHKRLHSIGGKGKYSKFAGFVGSHYPPPTKICLAGSANKKIAADTGETNGDKGIPHS